MKFSKKVFSSEKNFISAFHNLVQLRLDILEYFCFYLSLSLMIFDFTVAAGA